MNKTEDDELDAKELTEEEIQQVTGRATVLLHYRFLQAKYARAYKEKHRLKST